MYIEGKGSFPGIKWWQVVTNGVFSVIIFVDCVAYNGNLSVGTPLLIMDSVNITPLENILIVTMISNEFRPMILL